MTHQDNDDKRRLDRVRTILAAQAVLGKGLADVACQIKDISDTGARLFVDGKAFLPDRFELRIPKKQQTHYVQVRWRQGTVMGVEFVIDRRIDDRRDPTVRIKELETENAELRRRIASMNERLYNYGDTERFAV